MRDWHEKVSSFPRVSPHSQALFIRSDEGPSLEMLALKSFYSDSYQLVFGVSLAHQHSTTVS